MIVWHRVYADFLMPSRLPEYGRFLESVLAAGYRVVGIEAFWRLATAQAGPPNERLFVLRHDIDTDPGTAAAMWSIERSLGIASCYFFRLSTVEPDLMARIAADRGEVGYHYEELATIAKARRLRTRESALAALPAARELFSGNLNELRSTTGLPVRTAASHGDFVNRQLGVPNSTILEDHGFRHQVGIDLEGYDEALISRMRVRSTDAGPPSPWRYTDPVAAIGRREPVVYVLVHPRHWRVARAINARDDLRRLREGLAFRR
jgi:hypothetical protein